MHTHKKAQTNPLVLQLNLMFLHFVYYTMLLCIISIIIVGASSEILLASEHEWRRRQKSGQTKLLSVKKKIIL